MLIPTIMPIVQNSVRVISAVSRRVGDEKNEKAHITSISANSAARSMLLPVASQNLYDSSSASSADPLMWYYAYDEIQKARRRADLLVLCFVFLLVMRAWKR
jgi:hypothetical protein